MISRGKKSGETDSKRRSMYIDWRKRLPGIFTNFEVQDQKDTETCWAFAVALCVSLLAVIEFGVPNDNCWKLSVQELVDRVCQVYEREKIQAYKKDMLRDNEFIFKQDANGTYGALTAYGFIYCKEYGISYAHTYPFMWRRNLGKSIPSEDELPRVYISDYKILRGSASIHMDEILALLEKRPLVGKLFATPEFYKSKCVYFGRESGVEHFTKIGDELIPTPGHSVVILGYVGPMDCFLILNSWGEKFGCGGFLLVSSHLLFDVGWPILSVRRNAKCENRSTPRKRQFCEHVVAGSGSILASTKQEGTDERSGVNVVYQPVKKAREGGLRATLFVFGLMGLDSIGFLANMMSLVLYFLNVMHFIISYSASTTINYLGTAFLLTLLGGLVSDSYMSRLNTCLLFGGIELLGYLLLLIQSHYSELQPEACRKYSCVDVTKDLLFYASICFTQTTINAGPSQVHFRNQETRVCSVLGTKLMSRLSSSETALVCKTFDGVHAMESCDIEGAINRNYGLHGLGSSVGRTVDGRFLVISLANLRPYVGDFIADDLQRRLDLLKSKLPSGEIPSGFLGYAVNLVHNDKAKLCVRTSSHGLRETCFYHLFSRLLVYRTREDMLQALLFIIDGALYLDSGIIRSPADFYLGDREKSEVKFRRISEKSGLLGNYFEIENNLQSKKWNLERLLEDRRRQQSMLDQAKFNFKIEKPEFVRILA